MAKAVVLGGSGFIGMACARALEAEGFDVVSLSRSRPLGWGGEWISADISKLSDAEWQTLMRHADVVVNAAGALQDGARDSLERVHVHAVERMVRALQGSPARVVQISAAGVDAQADTHFFRTKALGDNTLMQGHDNWVVLRPGLVIGPEAYGGTALLRAHAGFPGISWRLFDAATIQTVSLADVVGAVVACARGDVPSGLVAELAEDTPHEFAELSEQVRRWQGFTAQRMAAPMPGPLLRLLAGFADVAGWLGWRSPLRSTSLRVMQAGIHADVSNWQKISGKRLSSLEETLSSLPAHTQERWFARMYLLLPLTILVLSVFWLLSGLVGVMQTSAAIEVLVSRGQTESFARVAVLGGSFLDIGLGAAILWRRWARAAAAGMLLVSFAYLVGSLLFAPDLWLDPLGPMVKVLPSMLAALIPLMFLEKR
ncbi:SDR family oxidoreductase [Shimia sediminis]|uniref:SDR family oxidoreductase n=1 Tax=Shimia sediminis TaxID=2497945 RepID=UPI000F8D3D0C|nr:SDR family oxidoreductase [Shimia sediminis]